MTLALVIFFAGAVLVGTSRASLALAAYAVVASAASILIVPAAAGSLLAVALLSLTTVIKIAIVPLVILGFIHVHPAARSLRPSLSAPLRLLLVVALVLIAIGAVRPADVGASPLLEAGIFIVISGVGMLLVHRNLIAHVIALLALGTGVTLCGAVLAPGLPEAVELGATFDALVGTFVGLTLVRAFVVHDPLLDVTSLRRLRG